MIQTDTISTNALKIIAPDKLKADDFRQVAPQIEAVITSVRENQIADRRFGIQRLGEYCGV